MSSRLPDDVGQSLEHAVSEHAVSEHADPSPAAVVPDSPPPATAADDEAPDTVRRRIEPGPDAIGERRVSGVGGVSGVAGAEPQAVEPPAVEPLAAGVVSGESGVVPSAEAGAAQALASPPEPAADAAAFEREFLELRAAAFSGADMVPAGFVAPAVSDTRELAGPLEPSQAEGDAAPGLSGSAEASPASEAVAVSQRDVCAGQSLASAPEAAPTPAVGLALVASEDPLAAEVGAATLATELAPLATESSLALPELGSAGSVQSTGESAGAPLEAGVPAPAESGGEVTAGWIEQGISSEAEGPFFEAELEREGSGEVPAGWIEQGAGGADAATEVAPSGRQFSTPWIDEEAEPVTPAERGRPPLPQTADLPMAEELRGRVLANRFLAEEIAEQSASSITYSAYHLALDSPVMVQVLPKGLAATPEVAELVRRTAVAASMIGNPYIARTLDFGVFGGGWPYWVAEHMDGKSLARILAEDGRVALRRVLVLAKQLAAGLQAAHGAGIVHGHLKPDCLIVVDAGSRAEAVRILGFGLLHASGGQASPPSSGAYGVPYYVSPEQAACRPCDERADLYSLGAVLYELMTGSPPFSGGDFAAVLCQHLDDEPEPPSARLASNTALSRSMSVIVQRCLAKDPDERYASADELGQALARLEQSIGTSRRRPMPEVARPTATIHTPPPRADSATPPGPKVIVRADLEEESAAATPVPAAAAERPTPPLPLPEDPEATRLVAAVGRGPRVAPSHAAASHAAASHAAASHAAASHAAASHAAPSHVAASHGVPGESSSAHATAEVEGEHAAGDGPAPNSEAAKAGPAWRGIFDQLRSAVQRLGREAKGE